MLEAALRFYLHEGPQRADNRCVTQIVFKPDWTRRSKAAPFKRNDRLLEIVPIGLIVFPDSGNTDKARTMGIPMYDFCPKAKGQVRPTWAA